MSDTIAFLTRRFSEYYRSKELYLPERFGKREWGFMFFEGGFMQRHLAFQSEGRLRDFLVERAPAHVYHSSAYYQTPDASTMAEKNWLGADLIFDLDADHIKGAEGLSYEETLAKVKEEYIRLIDDFLLSDLGFSEEQLLIVFSGGRGYHIHIRDPQVVPLTSHERREIVDYITGRDLEWGWVFEKEAFDKRSFGGHVKVLHKTFMPRKGEGGWKKKMSEGIFKLLDELEVMGEEEAVKRLSTIEGVGDKTARGIYTHLFKDESGNRQVDRLRNEENIEVLGKYLDIFLDIVKGEVSVRIEGDEERGIDAESLTVKDKLEGETDEPVTSDIKRLIRLPSSLHGKTGLCVTVLSRDDLDTFEPLRDAVSDFFPDDPVAVKVAGPVNVKLKGEHFDLREGETEIPEYAAIFLLCRRLAELSGSMSD
ncbi:MAG: DNA primase catalytic subunit PriS [Thermoplasmata archaeon]|nr:MAG: DNA primase catalytic subunit PriS [Thermoplasmata archaeon]